MTARISVSVRYHNMLRRRAGIPSETVSLMPGARLRDALEALAAKHDLQLREMLFTPGGEISSLLVVFYNGKLIQEDRAGILLEDGDKLLLFPATSGG